MSKEKIKEYLDFVEDSDIYWLNLFNVHPNATEKQITELYKDIPSIEVFFQREKNSIDVGFKDKEDVLKAVDLGNSEIEGQLFYIRSSNLLFLTLRFQK